MNSYRHHAMHPIKAIGDCNITLGQSLEPALLCNDRAVVLPQYRMLIISDLHIGKSTCFRHAGIAVPREVMQRDLQRLGRLITHYDVERLVIAGDFFHDRYNAEFDDFLSWRQEFKQIRFDLVQGNHDRLDHTHYEQLDFNVHRSELQLAASNQKDFLLRITHYPIEKLDEANHHSFVICGHIHPGVKIGVTRQQRITRPCFMADAYQLIIPAYSLFTGLDTRFSPKYRAKPMDKYVLTETSVLPIKHDCN